RIASALNSGVYFLAIVNPPSIYIVLQKIDSQKLCPLFMLTAIKALGGFEKFAEWGLVRNANNK
ncbi:MAG: hypothetical protein LKJ83_02970, partial [Eubacteriaceae bacterium]|nr:hypothetical protein [Eubacteriaceae bacterium]